MHDHTQTGQLYIMHKNDSEHTNSTTHCKVQNEPKSVPYPMFYVPCSMSQASCLEPKGLSQEVNYQLIEMYAGVLP